MPKMKSNKSRLHISDEMVDFPYSDQTRRRMLEACMRKMRCAGGGLLCAPTNGKWDTAENQAVHRSTEAGTTLVNSNGSQWKLIACCAIRFQINNSRVAIKAETQSEHDRQLFIRRHIYCHLELLSVSLKMINVYLQMGPVQVRRKAVCQTAIGQIQHNKMVLTEQKVWLPEARMVEERKKNEPKMPTRTQHPIESEVRK